MALPVTVTYLVSYGNGKQSYHTDNNVYFEQSYPGDGACVNLTQSVLKIALFS